MLSFFPSTRLRSRKGCTSRLKAHARQVVEVEWTLAEFHTRLRIRIAHACADAWSFAPRPRAVLDAFEVLKPAGFEVLKPRSIDRDESTIERHNGDEHISHDGDDRYWRT